MTKVTKDGKKEAAKNVMMMKVGQEKLKGWKQEGKEEGKK